jgi:hypothetical protein
MILRGRDFNKGRRARSASAQSKHLYCVTASTFNEGREASTARTLMSMTVLVEPFTTPAPYPHYFRNCRAFLRKLRQILLRHGLVSTNELPSPKATAPTHDKARIISIEMPPVGMSG